jgi:hypothetical protein
MSGMSSPLHCHTSKNMTLQRTCLSRRCSPFKLRWYPITSQSSHMLSKHLMCVPSLYQPKSTCTTSCVKLDSKVQATPTKPCHQSPLGFQFASLPLKCTPPYPTRHFAHQDPLVFRFACLPLKCTPLQPSLPIPPQNFANLSPLSVGLQTSHPSAHHFRQALTSLLSTLHTKFSLVSSLQGYHSSAHHSNQVLPSFTNTLQTKLHLAASLQACKQSVQSAHHSNQASPFLFSTLQTKLHLDSSLQGCHPSAHHPW